MENKLFVFSSKDVLEEQRQCKNFAYCASVSFGQETENTLKALCDCNFLQSLQILADRQVIIQLQFFDLIFSRFISYFSKFYALKEEAQISMLFNALNAVYEAHTNAQNLDFVLHGDIDVFADYLEEIRKIFMAVEDNVGLLNMTSDIISSIYLPEFKHELSFSDFDEKLISYSFDSLIANVDGTTCIQALPVTLNILKSSFPNAGQGCKFGELSMLGIFMENFCEGATQLFNMAIYDYGNMHDLEIQALKKFWIYFMRSHSSGIYPKCLFDRCNELLGVNTKDKQQGRV